MSSALNPPATSQLFGSFNATCFEAPLPLCPLVGFPAGQGGVATNCYARNGELFGKLVFMPSTLPVYLIALLMTGIMIWNVKRKYTAVGRKEMVIFFYLYLITTLLEFLLVSGAIPAANAVYPFMVAGHLALISATLSALLMNGFVGFQFIEDGTPRSLWTIRLVAALVFVLTFFVAGATFQGWLGLFNKSKPIVLWIVYYVLNGAFVLIYAILQIILVINTLSTRWPVGDILLGTAFFGIAYSSLSVFSGPVCDTSRHYIDGLFFATSFNLLAVLMVYKYWDSITKEDLEFAMPGSKTGNWELRENTVLQYESTPRRMTHFSPSPYANERGSIFSPLPYSDERMSSLGPLPPPVMTYSVHPTMSEFTVVDLGYGQPTPGARSPAMLSPPPVRPRFD